MAYDENIYARIVSGEISESEIAQLKATGEWEEIQAILLATEQLQLEAHNKESGYEALLKKRDANKQGTKIRRLLLPIASVAAALLLLFAAYLLLSDNRIMTSAANGTLAELSLDGVIDVTLNDGSSLGYEEGSKQGNRQVNLEGEAFFKVVPGNKLEVQTGTASVKVLGTEFNVRAWGDNLTVDCYEGKVAVDYEGQQAVLIAGQRLEIRNAEQGPVLRIQGTRPSWMKGSTRIKEEPLTQVFEELERQFDIRIKHENWNKTFSGEFKHNDLDKALTQVCSPMGLKFKSVAAKQIEVYE